MCCYKNCTLTLLLHIGFIEIGFGDIVDILLVSLLLYHVYLLIEGSVAMKVFWGGVSFSLAYLVVKSTGMEILSSILGRVMEVGVLVSVILFQREIKKVLFLLGGTTTSLPTTTLLRHLLGEKDTKDTVLEIIPIIEALEELSKNKTGALIVLTRGEYLKFYEESGDYLRAVISKRLLLAIFNKHSPLHDGGVILHGGKIVAARCILPVTERRDLPSKFGLRHRVAVGITEVTDTLALVVSEERGHISLAKDGILTSKVSLEKVREVLLDYWKVS